MRWRRRNASTTVHSRSLIQNRSPCPPRRATCPGRTSTSGTLAPVCAGSRWWTGACPRAPPGPLGGGCRRRGPSTPARIPGRSSHGARVQTATKSGGLRSKLRARSQPSGSRHRAPYGFARPGRLRIQAMVASLLVRSLLVSSHASTSCRRQRTCLPTLMPREPVLLVCRENNRATPPRSSSSAFASPRAYVWSRRAKGVAIGTAEI